MNFLDELKRRSVVKTAILYGVSGWLILQVADLLFDLMGLPETWLRLVLALLLLGFPLVLVFSWVYEMTPEGLKREKDIDRGRSTAAETGHKLNRVIAVLLVVAIGTVVIDRLVPETATSPGAEPGVSADGPAAGDPGEKAAEGDPAALAGAMFAPAPDRSIAVLPFVNMSGDPDNEYFADGLSEEILNFLADVPDLRVTARTSSFQFKGRNVDIREVASALDVANVLEGSVRREGERARITAQLIRASDGYHLWSEAYDRTLEDTFEVQTEIADNVTRALGIVMDEHQRARMLEVGVRDVEAFILYQRATELFFEAHTNQIDMTMLGESAALYDEAIALEPKFAAAYHMRSDFSAHRMTMIGPTAGERAADAERHAADLAQAVRYARNPYARALIEVDQTLASDNWRPLRERLEAALASPTCDEGTWVEVAPAFGYTRETLDRAERMIACDPLNFYNHYQAAMALFLLDRQGESIAAAERGLEVAPNHPFLESLIVKALLAQGRLDEALAQAQAITSWSRDGTVAGVFAAKGDLEAARPLIDRVVAEAGPWHRNYLTATLAPIIGDRARANEAAAWYDSLPGGPLMLTGVIMECACGAPFDLEATPNFRQRLAETGVDWPPPPILDYPAMRGAGDPTRGQ